MDTEPIRPTYSIRPTHVSIQPGTLRLNELSEMTARGGLHHGLHHSVSLFEGGHCTRETLALFAEAGPPFQHSCSRVFLQDVGLIFLSAIASSVVGAAKSAGLSDQETLGTVLVTLAASTLMVGLLIVAVGAQRGRPLHMGLSTPLTEPSRNCVIC